MRKRLQRAAAIGMAALLCVQNAQFGLTTFADELSDLAKREEMMNTQGLRVTPNDAVKNLSGADNDSNTGKNGEIKENPDGNFEVQENEQDDMGKASNSDAKKEESSGIGNTIKKDETKKFQIQSFEWGDPEEYPKGEPMIASVTEETRASFEELTAALPQEIRAIVSEEEKAEDSTADENEEKLQDDSSREETIPIVSWTCPEYKTDEDGKWPLSGEFIFAAELPGEYEVAESCDAVEMTVILDGGVELLAVDDISEILDIGGTGIFCNSTTKKLIDQNNKSEIDSVTGTGYKISYDEGTQTYILDLNGANTTYIDLVSGKWQINVQGNNTIENSTREQALKVWRTVTSLTIDFKDNSKLICKGGDRGLYLGDGTKTTLSGNGTLEADTKGYHFTAAENFGIHAGLNTELKVQENASLKVGESSAANLGIVDLQSGAKLSITSNGKVCLNHGLKLGSNSNFSTGSLANVTINYRMEFGGNCSLNNAGNLELNGTFVYPTVTNSSISNSGKLSGTMDLGVYKQTPGMTRHNKTITISNSWKETGVDLQGLFETTPEKLPVEYRLSTVSSSPDGAKIENGKLKITVPGTYYIQARVVIEGEKANFYQLPAGGTYYYTDGWMRDHAVVVVSAAELSGDAYQVIEFRDTYDGEPHNIAEVIYDETQVKFRGYRKIGDNSSLTQNCPQITNVSEIAAYVNTWEAVFWDDLSKKEITKIIYPWMYRPRLDEITIEIEYKGKKLDLNTPIELPCNSENQLPDTNDIKIYWYNGNGVRKLVSGKDCQLTFTQQEMIHAGDKGELKLDGWGNGNNNFDYHREITLFKMVPRKVQLKATIPDKIYDGTTSFPDKERANVKLSIANPLNASEEKASFTILGYVRYDSANVGQRQAEIYAISSNNSDYKCDYTQTFDAQIVKASADNLEVTFNADKSVYGDCLTVKPTIKSKIKDEKAQTLEDFGAQFTYSLDGITYMSLDELVPKLQVGSNEIHYRMTTTNYADKEGTFTAEISNRTIQDEDFNVQVTGSQTYNGKGRALQLNYLNDLLKNSEPKVSYSLDPSETRTYAETLPELKDAGTYQVYYQITADNYDTYTSSSPVTVQIDKAPLTVTAGLKNPERDVVYGDSMPAFEASYTGFVNNETKETALTGTPVMTCSSYTSSSGAGTTHTITVEAGSGEGALSARNYNLTFTQGSFTVNKKQAAIQVTNYDDWKSYTYDGKSPEIKAIVEGDETRTVKVEIYAGNPASGSALAEIPKNVGTYTAKFTAAATANYGAAETNLPFDIVQRVLKVTAVDQAITYGDPAPQYTAVYAGFAEGESLESLNGTLSFACAYQQAKAGQSNENSNAGTYEITPAVAGLANYKVTPVAGTLTVGKKAPTFTDSALLKEKYPDGSRVYDGTSVDITPSTDGDGARSYLVENTETGEILTTDPVNVGNYKATYSVAEGTNYQAGSISYEFAITEAEMKNVTANGYEGIYDGHSHMIEVSVQDELVKDEVVEYGLEPDTYTGTDTPELIDAGTYPVYYQITAPNYKPYTGSAIVTITQKEIQVVTADQETTYLEEAPKFTVEVEGMVGEETLENQNAVLSFETAYIKGDDVGEYAVQAVVDGLKNYKVEIVPGTLKVRRRTPVFTNSANLYTTRVYDGKAVDLTPTTDGDGQMSRVITNRKTNEVLTSDPVDVGEYRVVYSVSEGKNYTAGSVSYDFAITQAPLVITAENKNVTFGSKAPEYTVVYDGFVNGETEAVLTGTLVVTCDYTVKSRESVYEIIPSGLSAKNYAITWKNGVLTGQYPESDSDDYEETSKPANSKMPKSGTNNSAQGATQKDAQKGYVNENSGIVSGKTLTEEMLTNNSESLNDGYSHWIKTDAGWWFRYADGSYPKAAKAANSGSSSSSAAPSYEWVQIDGSWWSFDSDGYLGTGWILDPVYGNWFYIDVNTGMKTGWVLIGGKWYYFNPVSDGTRGIMFANRLTPDGWFVREDGSWDEKR